MSEIRRATLIHNQVVQNGSEFWSTFFPLDLEISGHVFQFFPRGFLLPKEVPCSQGGSLFPRGFLVPQGVPCSPGGSLFPRGNLVPKGEPWSQGGSLFPRGFLVPKGVPCSQRGSLFPRRFLVPSSWKRGREYQGCGEEYNVKKGTNIIAYYIYSFSTILIS